MQRALSTHLFANHRLTTAWLDRCWNSGIPLVEIFAARQHLDYRDRAQINELAHWFRDAELKMHSMHSPMFSDDVWGRSGPNAVINICELTRARRIQSVDEIKRALEIAENIPFRYLIQHIGVTGEEYDERKIDSTLSSLEEITVFASHRGVEVLLENTPNELASASRLLLFLDTTHMDLNVCFDIGHAHMLGAIESEYKMLQSRIRSTHIHDNNGKEDLHLFPMHDGAGDGGTIDWGAAMKLLRSTPGQYPLLLELKDVPDMGHPLDVVKMIFDRLEGLKTPHEF